MMVLADGEVWALDQVREVLSGVVGVRYVFYTGEIVEGDGWDEVLFKKRLLGEGDWEVRMEAAFEVVFGEGHDKVVFVRPGASGLRPSDLNLAFRELALKDRVVGELLEGRRGR